MSLLPSGDIVDLGCGAGGHGSSIKRRFPKNRLIGVEGSEDAARKASFVPAYDQVFSEDTATWRAASPPAMIFASDHLQAIQDHPGLLRRLARMLVPGGTLAVQMPRQKDAASDAMLRVTAEALFPDRFEQVPAPRNVLSPLEYLRMLQPLGTVTVWETEYFQRLEPNKFGHPVTRYSETRTMRPYLERLSETERVQFMVTYDAAMKDAYPAEPDGSVILPVRRVFMVLAI